MEADEEFVAAEVNHIMVAFHMMPESRGSFQLMEVAKDATLESIIFQHECSEDWDVSSIRVKVSSSRSGSYDKFSLRNSVSLVARILKTDILWIIFDKVSTSNKRPVKNAFDMLKSGANLKALPDPLVNPFNQKQELFNGVLHLLKEKNVTFKKTDCDPRMRNKKTGAATEVVYEITEIIWKIGQAESQFRNRSLWSKIPETLSNLMTFELKSKDPVSLSTTSSSLFATHIREVASKAIMASQNLSFLKLALLNCAEIFIKYSEYLKSHQETCSKKKSKDQAISTAAEAVLMQISSREKVSLVEEGKTPLKNPVVKNIFRKLEQGGFYQPLNISTLLPTNRCSRSTILNRDIPNQAPNKVVLWTFDNGSSSPQSIFLLLVDPSDSYQTILNKTSQLKSKLQSLQKFYYPREFYCQFYDKIGSVTGVSPQDLKLVCSMVMGEDRRFDGEVQKRFEEAVMSGDPDYIYDMRHFNGSEIKYKKYLEQFRIAVQEYMVEDRGRHETKYDGTVVSKVSFGFSLKQMFRAVCEKVKEKFPDIPLPKSEAMVSRYLIPRTRAAADSACRSEPLIPLKLAMQQKVIEKPNVDAHYNAAQYKYLRSFVVMLGPEIAGIIGWDDKTGVDIGEPEQPTAATQHSGRSWVHQERQVGEGQHSFHKTNLTPSVRLVHEIGSAVEDSFYRGLPQVVIKDAIFEPSSSARHATEVFQMLLKNPHLRKPVQVFTNDGGSDHTIRYERNIVAMLALFLRLPEVVFMINFQMAAYRSAYHPVEKLNCILNLCWNGLGLSREVFEDPVLEKAFGQCSSMAEVRSKAEKHPGIKQSLKKCLAPSIKILEERAKQGSLKENTFEVFKAASDEEIKEFLGILVNIDPEFNVDRFLDKKKPYHFSPLIKDYIEEHVTVTHYSLTFMRDQVMTKDILNERYPSVDWPIDLEPIPCPVVDKENPEKYLSFDQVTKLNGKDYTDACRPGASLKTPPNIPFSKTKQRALYGAKLALTCETCGKPRVVYMEYKPSAVDLKVAKAALVNVRYICGGRISSCGRSLAVLEEIVGVSTKYSDINDEIDLQGLDDNDSKVEDTIPSDISDEFELICEPANPRKKKTMIIESDESDGEEVPQPLVSSEQSMAVDDAFFAGEFEATDLSPKCSFCEKFRTSHKCRLCGSPCCNFCNKEEVEELTDIVCPKCKATSEDESLVLSKKRARPKKNPQLPPSENNGKKKKNRVTKPDIVGNDNNNNNPTTASEDNNSEADEGQVSLTELRILGNRNILKKIFVDESLVCDSPVEAHMFDNLIAAKKPLPCFYCGESEDDKLAEKLTAESFPLCISCQDRGRGAGARRKSRKIIPKQLKKVKPKVVAKKKKPRSQLIS